MDISQIYQALPGLLLPWYRENARDLPWRRDREPYHVWLSEIMLQQTRVEAVRGYYTRFLERFPTLEALAAGEEGALLKAWEGLGYYSRARNLQKAARKIVKERQGVFPREYGEILDLPGVGPYTAGAVASICFNQPVAAVDGNVLRVLSRVTSSFVPVDLPQVRKDMAARLEAVYPREDCGAFTQALMELGALCCTPKSPGCPRCPLREICRGYGEKTAEKLPVRLPKRDKRTEQRTVFLLECDGALALERRKEAGLLGGLWQLPNQEGVLSPEEALAWAAGLKTEPVELRQELHRVHVFTHIRWEMTGYRICCRRQIPAFQWADRSALRAEYALPTAFRCFLEE